MHHAIWFLLTLLAAFAVGYPLSRLRMPGGMMVGAMVGACALNLATGSVWMPDAVKTVAQILAGAMIGAGVSRDEVRGMRTLIKPAAILLPSLLILNVGLGFLVRMTGGMDLITALMCTTPGGITNIPMIAADLGADPAKVVVLQFVRLVMGVGLFPVLIRALEPGAPPISSRQAPSVPSGQTRWRPVLLTILTAGAAGVLGDLSPIPSGTMAFATLSTIALKMMYPAAQTPRLVGRLAQCLSGAFVGAGIGWVELRELGHLPVPIVLTVVCYSLGAWGISNILWRTGCFTRKASMLAATPAGASDMALISADMGVHNVNLVLLQIMRLVVVVTVFPSILNYLAHLFG